MSVLFPLELTPIVSDTNCFRAGCFDDISVPSVGLARGVGLESGQCPITAQTIPVGTGTAPDELDTAAESNPRKSLPGTILTCPDSRTVAQSEGRGTIAPEAATDDDKPIRTLRHLQHLTVAEYPAARRDVARDQIDLAGKRVGRSAIPVSAGVGPVEFDDVVQGQGGLRVSTGWPPPVRLVVARSLRTSRHSISGRTSPTQTGGRPPRGTGKAPGGNRSPQRQQPRVPNIAKHGVDSSEKC